MLENSFSSQPSPGSPGCNEHSKQDKVLHLLLAYFPAKVMDQSEFNFQISKQKTLNSGRPKHRDKAGGCTQRPQLCACIGCLSTKIVTTNQRCGVKKLILLPKIKALAFSVKSLDSLFPVKWQEHQKNHLKAGSLLQGQQYSTLIAEVTFNCKC